MNVLLEKLYRAPWQYRQPITQYPGKKDIPVSDLFIWRKGEQWKTTFELLNLPALIDSELDKAAPEALIFVLDNKGNILFSRPLSYDGQFSRNISLNELLDSEDNVDSEYGTFCVFHTNIPCLLKGSGSFLAERGYISYQYGQQSLRSYVHGNLDAVALETDDLKMLGGKSILRRKYNLQYNMDYGIQHEIGLVNPTSGRQRLTLNVESVDGKNFLKKQIILQPRGCVLESIPETKLPSRLTISSRLVMSRPIVFKFNQNSMDVFHG